MGLSLRISEAMNKKNLIFLENRTIRVPETYRESLGFTLGEFLKLTKDDGSEVVLQVAKAYNEDLQSGEMTAYVTEEIYNSFISKGFEIESVPEIMLGCDPEFFLVDSNTRRIMHAGKYFNKWDKMGHDGAIAEIRPDPSTDIDVVLRNIRSLLLKGRKKLNNVGDFHVKMLARSAYNGITAGFHLHFGLPPQLLGIAPFVGEINKQITQVLDYYVGLPCILQEGIQDATRRCTTFVPYGKAGDFRLDSRTLEYRVPGAALLKHPTLTRGLIATGALVVENALIRIKEASDNFECLENLTNNRLVSMYSKMPGALNLYSLICVPNIDGALAYKDIILDDLRHMTGYEKRRSDIEAFFENLCTPITDDLTNNWGLNEASFH